MKTRLSWISLLVIIMLASCNLPSSGGGPPVIDSTATLSPDEIQTQISAMLTLMPTATEQLPGIDASPTSELPTLAVVTATPEDAPALVDPTTEPAEASTNTPQPQDPTATTAPQQVDEPTATVTASPIPTLPSGSISGDWDSATDVDHMDNAQTWNWPTGRDRYTQSIFANGAQEIVTLSEKDGWRMANPSPTGYGFSNISLEAVFKTGAECSGNAHYGIIVRVPVLSKPDQGYLFGVTCDGRYSLRRWDGEVKPKGEMWDMLQNDKYFFEGSWAASPAINKGSNQVNRLRIDTIGNTFTLYANGTRLAEVQANQVRGEYFSSGYFGVFAGPGNMDQLRIQLDEMAYWQR